MLNPTQPGNVISQGVGTIAFSCSSPIPSTALLARPYGQIWPGGFLACVAVCLGLRAQLLFDRLHQRAIIIRLSHITAYAQ